MTRRRARTRQKNAIQQMPYRQVRNPFSPMEVLTPEQIERIHGSSMRVLEETGLHVMDTEARSIFKAGGFSVDETNQRVRFDRDGLMALVAKAPSSFSIRGRDPNKRITVGEGNMCFAAVAGPPFVSDLDHGRRAGSYEDMCNVMKIVHSLNILHNMGGCSVEPVDLPAESRYLDFYLQSCLLSDKPWKPVTIGRHKARDALAMAKIMLQASDEALAADPVFYVNTNTNTPLVLDPEIAQGVIEFARAGQAVCVTPFALAGAMAPATVAGALTLQNAETLAACALVQLVRPGCPYIYGSFVCNADMRSGSPAFGTPEYALGAQASGQMARHYGLPWRSSNANASNAPDAQAAYEAQMALWGAITGHVSILHQGAGWLEGGLVASYEKLIIDAEMLQMMAAWMDGLTINEDEIGLDAISEVGPGGHFFGTAHTLERYEHAFYQPLLSDWSNFENWADAGSKDAATRANGIWKSLLQDYEPPEIDIAIKDELEDYVARRKRELHQ
ncbi:trimethylamine methyltransferase family protein [Coralliovum pocilloporae]|uniref:trimethylamine methyltransferase family protein n=1 Tax=Coralliovum pocilloporae TaxID=3066369 RepID=UPI003307A856